MNALDGKIAVVVGASAALGTGWAIAETLAAAGAKVVVGARSEAPLQRLAAKIGGTAAVCDITKEEDVKNIAATALRAYGKLDIAVNASGVPVLKTIAESTLEDIQAGINGNYFGNVFFVKHMAEAIGRDGSIIVVSSLSTTHPVFPHFAYACAKSAADCLVRYAAIEYGPRNIRINSILPGAIVSDMSKELMDAPGVMETFEKEVPLGRVGYPADFANAALWLADSAYVTGLNIPLCGGNQLTRFPFPSEFPSAEKAWDIEGKTLFDREKAKAGQSG